MVAPRGVSLPCRYERVIVSACIDDGSIARAPPEYRMPFVIAQLPSASAPRGASDQHLSLGLGPDSGGVAQVAVVHEEDARLPTDAPRRLRSPSLSRPLRRRAKRQATRLARLPRSKPPCSEGSHGLRTTDIDSL
jgi:hypothetical protein